MNEIPIIKSIITFSEAEEAEIEKAVSSMRKIFRDQVLLVRVIQRQSDIINMLMRVGNGELDIRPETMKEVLTELGNDMEKVLGEITKEAGT